MGIIVVTEFVTLDGIGQAPGRPDEDTDGGFEHGGWQAQFGDPGVGEVIFEGARTMDALLLGRRTYEIFADYWPSAPPEIPFTPLLNDVPKHVCSRTLAEPLAWQHSSLVSGDAGDTVDAIRGLRERHREIHVIGSLDLVQTLLHADLVDRLDLWVYPVVLGSGKRLFAGGAVPSVHRLTASTTYPSGTLHLIYDAAGRPAHGGMG